jgi:arsenite/tail-anchored protein-transporting ATPase
VPELVFFIGKGGVGKTTVSSAYAVREAARHPKRRVLLVSTDPAHSLSDLFGMQIGSIPQLVPSGFRKNLRAWEIDSEHLFRSFVEEHKGELITAVERGSFFTGDEISSLLESALPGMSEMGALLAILEAFESGKHSTIVVDTAPFGHTLRLFGLPEQFEKLLNFLELAAERDQVLARHFGGRSLKSDREGFLEKWRRSLNDVRQAFTAAKLFLVTTAEEFALNESLRCIQTLQQSDPPLQITGMVLNRIIQRSARCGPCRARVIQGKQAARRLKKTYGKADLYIGVDPGFPIQGVNELQRFGDAVFAGKQVKWPKQKDPFKVPAPRRTAGEWPGLIAPLTFVLGKGGVGKTTVSAAMGYHSRQTSEDEIEICSVDPAPSLDDVFKTEVSEESRPVLGDSGFRASELDSVALYHRWVGEMRAEIDSATSVRRSGVQVDLSYERRLFSDLLEIIPPGLDEVLAIFRIIELGQRNSEKIVIDMAPTGHALELLRTPERILVWSRLLLKSLASHRKLALAREAAVKIAELEVQARELSHAFANGDAAVFAVMLPEPLPDRETERLLHELRTLQIVPKAVFVNRVVQPKGRACAWCSNVAEWQSRVLNGLKHKLQVKTVYAIPAFEDGPAGKSGLREITRKIWQLT